MEGTFVSVGDGSGDLFSIGIGKHFLVKFQLNLLPQGIEHDLISMARVDLLTFSVHSGSKRLKIQGDGSEQIYQLCDCCDKDSIFQNFAHCLKTHKSGQQWVEEAVRLQRCVSLPNVLPSYMVDNLAYQAVKATKSERWCIKEMKNQRRSNLDTSETTPTITKKNKKQSLLKSMLRCVLPCCFKANAGDDDFS